MSPEKVDRSRVARLEDLPNVGPATAADLRRIGIRHPCELCGQDGYALYDTLCRKPGFGTTRASSMCFCRSPTS